MTVRINLLPHREQKRVARQRQFAVLAGMTAGLGVFIAIAGHTVFLGQIDHQNGRNQYLKTEIANLEKEIEEIKDIKSKTDALLERKKVVESLQGNRSQVVHVFDELVRRLPEGLYLKAIEQKGTKIKLVGYAQSNARIASLMRNLDASPWLEGAYLVESKAAIVNNLRVNEFILEVNLIGVQPESGDSGKDGVKNDKPKIAAFAVHGGGRLV